MKESNPSWQQHFQQLEEYKLTHGHCHVPLNYSRHPHLGKWLTKQRSIYQTGDLQEERKDRLDGIGVLWKNEPLDIKWEIRFQELLEYKESNGDCNVPIFFNSNIPLGNWVFDQRQASSRGQMSKERKDTLDSIDFFGEAGIIMLDDADWDTRFQQLVDYKQKHGNCDVPYRYGPNPGLVLWLSKQHHSLKSNNMPKHRVAKLESIGFQVEIMHHQDCVATATLEPIVGVPLEASDCLSFWDKREIDWDTRFQQLVEYKQTHGNCYVPYHYGLNRELGRWVSSQHGILKSNKMRNDRLAKLESIGFWDAKSNSDRAVLCGNRKVTWDARFQQLVEYKQTHDGYCDVPLHYQSNPELGRWVSRQRGLLKCKKMRDDRIAKLETIGFWDAKSDSRPLTDKRKMDWEIRFQQLVEYKQNHGHCYVPYHYDHNQELSRWVAKQRSFLKCKKMMCNDRKAKLESIGFLVAKCAPDRIVLCGKKRVDWDVRFQQLLEFKETYEHCAVPLRYGLNPELGRWVSKLRQSLKKNKTLPKDRVAKLESIGFPVGQNKTMEDWDTVFEELREYVRNHGDCNVPETYNHSPSLVEWVRKQRHDYSLKCGGYKSAMTAEREAKLIVLGFLWEREESPLVGSKNDTHVLCPDEVTSERRKRQPPAGSNENPVFCPDEVTSEGPYTKKAKYQF